MVATKNNRFFCDKLLNGVDWQAGSLRSQEKSDFAILLGGNGTDRKLLVIGLQIFTLSFFGGFSRPPSSSIMHPLFPFSS